MVDIVNCPIYNRIMVIVGTDKNIPTYFCERCEIREGGSPIKERTAETAKFMKGFTP